MRVSETASGRDLQCAMGTHSYVEHVSSRETRSTDSIQVAVLAALSSHKTRRHKSKRLFDIALLLTAPAAERLEAARCQCDQGVPDVISL